RCSPRPRSPGGRHQAGRGVGWVPTPFDRALAPSSGGLATFANPAAGGGRGGGSTSKLADNITIRGFFELRRSASRPKTNRDRAGMGGRLAHARALFLARACLIEVVSGSSTAGPSGLRTGPNSLKTARG